jgi:hypothetical protein
MTMRFPHLLIIAATAAPLALGCAAPDTSQDESFHTDEPAARKYSLESIDELSADELDALFEAGDTKGLLPEGDSRGKAIFRHKLKFITNWLANGMWDGKVFYPDPDGKTGTLKNFLLGGKRADAKLYIDFNKDHIVLDYSESKDLHVRNIEDHMRRVEDDLYIGKAFYHGWSLETFLCYFALDFRKTDQAVGVQLEQEDDSVIGAKLTLSGTTMCSDCTLSGLLEEFPEMDTTRFYQLDQDGESAVLKVNTTDISLPFHILELSTGNVLEQMRDQDDKAQQLQVTGVLEMSTSGEDNTGALDSAELAIVTPDSE